MKQIFILLSLCIFSASVFSQVPEKINYQAIIRNSTGDLVANNEVGIRIQILQGSELGASEYVEVHTAMTNENGLLTIEIGTGSIRLGILDSIDWSAGPYFLKVETDPTGGTDYTITGISQILSIPYAFYAKKAGNGFSGNYLDLSNKPDLYDGTWANITNKPSTISGYGIEDAVTISDNQVISGDKSFNGTVTVNNPINANDAVNKAYVDVLLEKILQLQAELGLNDVEGNHYKAVKIGSQVWMAENLKTTKFRNGDSIKTTNHAMQDISNEFSPKYQWAYNGDEENANKYGRLYTWYAVTDDRNVCPTGWHLPSDYEWNELQVYLGMESEYSNLICDENNNISGILKETGTSNWLTPNIGATDEYGFKALPAGYRRRFEAAFEYQGEYACFWTNNEYDYDYAWYRHLYNNTANICRTYNYKNYGFSVRCIKD